MQNRARGIFGIVEQIGFGNPVTDLVDSDVTVRVVDQRPAFLGKQCLAQAQSLVCLPHSLLEARLGDVARKAGRLGSPRPVLHPRVHHSVIHNAQFDFVTRRKGR